MKFFKIYFLGCEPTIDLVETCEFTGVPPTAPPGGTTVPGPTTLPTHTCPQNEIPVGCDMCHEAFCCDSGRVSLESNCHNLYGIVMCLKGRTGSVGRWENERILKRIMGMSKWNDETSTWL